MAQQVVEHNRTVLDSLEEGDLVEFNRGLYSHWAVYKGSSDVIHLAGIGNEGVNANSSSVFTICGQRFNKAVVRVDDFWKVAGDSKAYKKSCNTRFSPQKILKRAMDKIGEIGYNLLRSNCEHFAKYCRYGEEKSEQVEKVVKVAGAAAVGIGVGALYYGMLKKKKKKDE
ncbi:phospholipase A and acyltransferase 2-like [Dreissena polymorpha]|uniref:LRAT domain-containing protein n=1 Tax=Dreissena polymorpha TaxID=45954 RepID=A0A9D4M2A7_DREPO|nr:phospholipase A and acyltransferase 2-like [Dreissena polymorpha]KAH3868354.1 hypothetical protein DPMN_031498 [Dreissena polymorpha]